MCVCVCALVCVYVRVLCVCVPVQILLVVFFRTLCMAHSLIIMSSESPHVDVRFRLLKNQKSVLVAHTWQDGGISALGWLWDASCCRQQRRKHQGCTVHRRLHARWHHWASASGTLPPINTGTAPIRTSAVAAVRQLFCKI